MRIRNTPEYQAAMKRLAEKRRKRREKREEALVLSYDIIEAEVLSIDTLPKVKELKKASKK